MRRTLALIAMTVLLTGCGAASNHNQPSGSPAASTHGASPTASSTPTLTSGNDPCHLITDLVIGLGAFDDPVSKVYSSSGPHGSTLCSYGDDPNPNEISVSALALGQLPPAFLNAQHVTARQEALLLADMCVRGTLLQLGPSSHIGSFAAFCIGTPGSVRGGWVQGGSVFSMSFFTPSEAKRSNPDRLAHYAEIASAISREIG